MELSFPGEGEVRPINAIGQGVEHGWGMILYHKHAHRKDGREKKNANECGNDD